MSMKIVVPTCKNYYFLLPVYMYLINTFWSEQQEVIIVGYEPLEFDIPPNFSFYSVAPESYPVNKWSDGIIEFLQGFQDDHFIFSLEDYFLTRGVDHPAIASLESFMGCNPDVWKVDLTGDRLYSGRSTDCGTWGHLDMIETLKDVPYCLSTQMCVMNRKHLLSIMKPGLEPWGFELQDQSKVMGTLRTLGTRQMPVRYTIGWGTGSNDEDGNLIPNLSNIPKRQLDFIKSQGWLDKAPKG